MSTPTKSKPPRKRNRSAPIKKWQIHEETALLNYLQDNPNFEKPTAAAYYRKFCEEIKLDGHWAMARDKVRNLRQSFNKAKNWLNSTGVGSLDGSSIQRTDFFILTSLNNSYSQLHEITKSPGIGVNERKYLANGTLSLGGSKLNIATFVHMPLVSRGSTNNSYWGLEIEVVNALSKVLNFQPHFYETEDREKEHIGRKLPNGSFTGLLRELKNRNAHIAVGGIHLHTSFLEVIESDSSYSFDCLSLLTPELSRDNTWNSFIQPFGADMWAGVIAFFMFVSIVLYLISIFQSVYFRHQIIMNYQGPKKRKYASDKTRYSLNSKFTHINPGPTNFDIFSSLGNCILLTYSMILYVALPCMPRSWPLRIITGWNWIYCILLTVTYRASFTALLANPPPRIAVDTIDQLSKSHIKIEVLENEDKKVFYNALDDTTYSIFSRIITQGNINDTIKQILDGDLALFSDEYYLRFLRYVYSVQQGEEKVLHLMRDCVICMPVMIALPKHSFLKPLINIYLRRFNEAGLIKKWRNDAIAGFIFHGRTHQETLMNLRKFWSSFVVLAVGYFLSVVTITLECMYLRYASHAHNLFKI